MVITDLLASDIPVLYRRFASIVGENLWKHQATNLARQIKENPLLDGYIQQEYSIVLQLAGLGQICHIQPPKIPEILYPASSFLSQVLSIYDKAPSSYRHALVRRVQDAIKHNETMRGLLFEFAMAVHFTKNGFHLTWPEITQTNKDGEGVCDFVIENLGPHGTEFDCKSISQDSGHKIPFRDALVFFNDLNQEILPLVKNFKRQMQIIITVPARLDSQSQRQRTVCEVRNQILIGKSGFLEDGTGIQIREFERDELDEKDLQPNNKRLRSTIDKITGTYNRQAIAIPTESGGLIIVALQSSQPDTIDSAIFDRLRKSSRKQFSKSRASVILVELGLDKATLAKVVYADDAGGGSILRKGTTKFLSSASNQHIVGINFISQPKLFNNGHGTISNKGSTYYFPHHKSKYWDDAFNAIF